MTASEGASRTNAVFSRGYVVPGNEIAALLEARGFDPAVGFLHGLRYGRQSLALDLVEAFRQPVIDRLTLRLLNLRQIGADDFEGGERGLLLKPSSFKEYLRLYEEHLRNESEGSGSPTWRAQVVWQVDSFREMVMKGEVAPVYSWPSKRKAEERVDPPGANLDEGRIPGEVSAADPEKRSN